MTLSVQEDKIDFAFNLLLRYSSTVTKHFHAFGTEILQEGNLSVLHSSMNHLVY